MPDVRAKNAQAADAHGHLGRRQRRQSCLVDQQRVGRNRMLAPEVVAEAVRGRLVKRTPAFVLRLALARTGSYRAMKIR